MNEAVVFLFCEKVARAVESVIPEDFRGRLSIVIDRGRVLPQNVEVTMRPPQPKDNGVKRM